MRPWAMGAHSRTVASTKDTDIISIGWFTLARTMLDTFREQVAHLPLVVWIAFISSLALLAFDAILLVIIALSTSSKIDPGVATLCGAVIGLSVVAWQARVGFQNLIKSQENQARIEREGRLHRDELDQAAEARAIVQKRADLLGGLRAEIAYLYSAVAAAEQHVYGLILIENALHRAGKPSQTKAIALHTFDAPIF